jgi:hypothetical protein
MILEAVTSLSPLLLAQIVPPARTTLLLQALQLSDMMATILPKSTMGRVQLMVLGTPIAWP